VARLGNITFACEDPAALCAFWADALGYQVQEAPPGFMEAWIAAGRDPNGAAAAVDPESRGPRLFFQRKPKSVTSTIPIHLDINAEDREAEVARLVALGATVVETSTRETGEFRETWTVMRDPEGNGFCVQ
jgi:catechol 2,3-dioxygenase-like lactoylglutathione lyase family enzyme